MQSSEGYLSVTGGKHRLFYRVDGPCDGLPVFIFHGGWGPRETDAACCEGTGKWRIVQLHQKGWGKSMPAGEVTNNTPMDVLADVEALRMHLGVQRWFVKGGSTGAMLAVLYAVEYPLSVSGVLMVGTWLLRTKDIDWCYRGGMGHFYPGEWKAFKQHVACRGGDPLVACWRMVFGEDKIVGMAAAQAFMKWDGTCGQLVPDPPEQRVGHDPEHAMVAARIALHWYVHMKESALLLGVRGRLSSARVRTIDIRYASAWALRYVRPEGPTISQAAPRSAYGLCPSHQRRCARQPSAVRQPFPV